VNRRAIQLLNEYNQCEIRSPRGLKDLKKLKRTLSEVKFKLFERNKLGDGLFMLIKEVNLYCFMNANYLQTCH